MQTAKGGILTIVLMAALLAGFGIWQFGGAGIGGSESGERETEEHGHVRSPEPGSGNSDATRLKADILARYGGTILEVEREWEQGREVWEVKLVDGNGQRRKLLVDADGREGMGD